VEDLAELPSDRLATVVGRYYAMDRDERWDRTEKALAALVAGEGQTARDPIAEIRRSYEQDVTDEFLEPIVVERAPRIGREDSVVFFNFRPDRGRQLTQKLLASGFEVTTMTRYREDLDTAVAFEEQEVTDTVAEVLAENGVRQLHAAETEKYAHVTYFFNGGREDEWPGETRILVPSPRDVPSYDHKPEMSAREVADKVVSALRDDGYGFTVVNFANPDMVGHTGSIPATVRAVETVDECLGRVVEVVAERGGLALVTADHGNAEQMIADDGSPHTAHTANPVPLIATDPDVSLREGGELSDLVPSVLTCLGLTKPVQMTGKMLLEEAP
jgi:2,3-bisphosphoglycerate-independent phosphoglycerate mutase